ncbi:MAG: acyltransferase [Blautia sp.]|nr:acyltransferase [Blautia sp.]
MKGIAIIFMLFHHLFRDPKRYTGYIVDCTPFPEPAINWVAASFKICVAMFTFLSAYGITLNYRKLSAEYRFSGKDATRQSTRRLVSLLGGYEFLFWLIILLDLFVIKSGRFVKIYGTGLRSVMNCLIDAAGLAKLVSLPNFLGTYWYMSLAIILIVLMPLLLKLYRSLGGAVVLFGSLLFYVLFPMTRDHQYAFLPNYLFSMVLGMVSADQNLIVLMDQKLCRQNRLFCRILSCSGGVLLVLGFLLLRQKGKDTFLMPICDGLIAFLLCFVVYAGLGRIPVLKKVLEILGKYSMNIFLVHELFRIIWCRDFIYSFQKWWLIFLVLFAVSFAAAVLIELLKKLLRYDRFVNWLRRS